jgi:hypothetical protein
MSRGMKLELLKEEVTTNPSSSKPQGLGIEGVKNEFQQIELGREYRDKANKLNMGCLHL